MRVEVERMHRLRPEKKAAAMESLRKGKKKNNLPRMKSSRLKKNFHRPMTLTVMNSSAIHLPAKSKASLHLLLPEEKAAAVESLVPVVVAPEELLEDSPLAVNLEARLRKAVASQALMRNSAFSKLVTL